MARNLDEEREDILDIIKNRQKEYLQDPLIRCRKKVIEELNEIIKRINMRKLEYKRRERSAIIHAALASRTCEECGSGFTEQQLREKMTRQYCSRSCAAVANNRNRKRNRKHMRKFSPQSELKFK